MKHFVLIVFIFFVAFSCSQTPVEVTAKNEVKPTAVNTSQSSSVPENEIFQGYDYRISFKNGDRASLSYWSSELHYYLDVYRDEVRNTTWLYYRIEENGIMVEYGHGYIPNEDFTGSYKEGWMHLETNTSEDSNPSFHRHQGEGGLIKLDWKVNYRWESQSGGYYIYHYMTYQDAYGGKNRNWIKSADVKGQLIGRDVDLSNGSIAKYEDTWVYLWYDLD